MQLPILCKVKYPCSLVLLYLKKVSFIGHECFFITAKFPINTIHPHEEKHISSLYFVRVNGQLQRIEDPFVVREILTHYCRDLVSTTLQAEESIRPFTSRVFGQRWMKLT
jgi:hypothetical protein